jgi:molecular chaperone GrpE (heat shock protein)
MCLNFLRNRAESDGAKEPFDGVASTNSPDWKEKALSDFTTWLEELPEEYSPGSEVENRAESALVPEAIDLFTLLKEFAALRGEIKFQNREQQRSSKTLANMADDFGRAMEVFEKSTRGMQNLVEKIRSQAEETIVAPFLDIRVALERGLAAARQTARPRGLLRRPPKGINGVVEGYEMALRRMDRALAQAGVTPIVSLGNLFDSETMRAVGTAVDPKSQKGIVLEEHLGGFMHRGKVLRTAQVVVNIQTEAKKKPETED